MKFTPEVVAALAVLRDAVENDFERHRLDVLERDLTAPPVVEIVDDTHQRFDGLVFRTNKNGHFAKAEHFIHRAVWSYYYGEIPEGYVVHHIDENKANNNIENLQCLSTNDHMRIHLPQGERIAVHEKTCFCAHCGKPFVRRTPSGKYCSLECREATQKKQKRSARQKKPLDERTCAICGKKFFVRPDKKQRCCSISCGNKLSFRERSVSATCPICGKEFIRAQHSNKIYCSKVCALRACRANQKKF